MSSCLYLLILCRIHHNQIVVNQVLVPVIDSLREHAKTRVHDLRVSVLFQHLCLLVMRTCSFIKVIFLSQSLFVLITLNVVGHTTP